MRFTHAALTVGLAVTTSLSLAGTAGAEGTVGAGRITATDYSAGSPATVALDPATGSVTTTFAQAAEDGVLAAKGPRVAYIQRRDTCIPQTEGCMYARDLVIADADGSDRRVLAEGVQPEDATAPYVGHPDWSPSGKRIVYDSPRGLEWIATDGTGAEVLTSGSRGTFSPDGRSIAFLKATSYDTPDGVEYGSDVYTLDLATREVRAVTTDHQAWSTAADRSPDGQRVVHSAGHGLRITDVATAAATEPQWPSPLSSIQNPVFSPDGSRIAFTAVDDSAGTSGAYVVDAADGGNLRVLTDRPVTLTDWLAN
ncbi:PD40 domain-containing protein [Streptomyces sp. MZ04]|uniref:TolB family protein n=1 Tax=Streptomyces sp. MZ04 TaxID=2559236 RepID=UPI0014332545|nr:PD40 domain-containing protein [Streptomyces sp. MZ04]